MKIIKFKEFGKSGKNKLFLIPFFFTFANALCGFLSVIKALEGEYAIAALCIIAAAVMDLCDGRLARMFNSVSVLGMELDSLCDAISFCFAPAILLYSWSLHNLEYGGIAVLGLYLCSGLFRLARFNTNAHMQVISFIGLPTTLAAFFFANVVLYQDWIASSVIHSVLRPDRIAFMVTIISLLMISTIRFPSVKAIKMHFATGTALVFIAALAGWIMYKGYPLLLVITTAFIIGSFLMGIFKEITKSFWKK